VATLRPLNLRFSKRAEAQLLAIEEYVAQHNPAAAIRTGVRIKDAAEVLQYFPFAGRPGRSAGTREWVVRGSPYLLVYEVFTAEEEVIILGVFHGAQKRE
jgi:toxin ParE1/3/4